MADLEAAELAPERLRAIAASALHIAEQGDAAAATFGADVVCDLIRHIRRQERHIADLERVLAGWEEASGG